MMQINSENTSYRQAARIVRTLHAAGHLAYLAGGCVRDLLLARTPSDYDVATSATPEQVLTLFTSLGRKTLSVGAHFGVVLVCPEKARPESGSQEEAIEVATFRHDGSYSDGRRPDAVRFSADPREDVLRRDFTINGMLLDIPAYERTNNLEASILDFVEGQEDLASGQIRAIGNPTLRFTEDKLRMLRAIRFAARLDFTLEPATESAIRSQAPEIAQVSDERTRDELTRMLTEGHAAKAFELLEQTGLLAHILPEATRLRGVQQPPEYHPEGDVWTHTLLLLKNLPPNPSPTLAWGALLHDIGKPATFQPPQHTKDRIRFNGHVEVGVRLSEIILARLRFSREDTDQILALVRNHMRFGDILHMKRSTLTRFLRLPHFEEHLALHRLDCNASHGKLDLYDFALREFHAEPPADLRPKPLLTGRDLIAAGYPPSPQFKAMLTHAEDAQFEGRITTPAEALADVIQHFGPPPEPTAASPLPPSEPNPGKASKSPSPPAQASSGAVHTPPSLPPGSS